MAESPVLINIDNSGVARITLNRPKVNNAYNGELIDMLLRTLDGFNTIENVRAVLLCGNGRHFQAGADLTWISTVRTQSAAANLAVSRATAEVVDRLNHLPVPVVALVQGACFGGATGVVAACDIVVAADDAFFSIAEAHWGLHASIIIPQLSDAISIRQVRRYALTGERFDAIEAHRIGLVHEVVPRKELRARGETLLSQILRNGPEALVSTKQHILDYALGTLTAPAMDKLIRSHAAVRRTAEAGEGLAAFAEKRDPAWVQKIR